MAEADEYGFPDEGADNHAAMLAEIEQQADARTLRLALGVDDDELDLIRIGHAPSEKTAERLRLLHEVSSRADLSDPGAVLAALGANGEGTRPRSPAAALSIFGAARHAKLVIAAFVLVDVLVALGIIAFLALRGA